MLKKRVLMKLMGNKKLVGVITIAVIVIGVGLNSISNAQNSVVKYSISQSDAYVRNVDGKVCTPDKIEIMGYKPMDYAQAMSYILTCASANGFSVEDMDLNGITLEEHLVNTNTVAYYENVDPNVILVQQLIETSHYMYKYTTNDGTIKESSVKPEYHNFAGLGATDSNPKPSQYSNDIHGQLAQTQHLVAYATTEDVKTKLVDDRFQYVQRGKAPTVLGLSKAWASNESYGQHIAKKYTELINHEVNEGLVKKYAKKVYG